METDETEQTAQLAWQSQDFERVARIVLPAYGSELYGFVMAQFPGKSADADDVFSQFSEDFWRGLPQFQWRCSIRAWCYKLVRSASSRHRRLPSNRANHRVPLSQAPAGLTELVQVTRSQTQAYLRTEVKDRIRELRDQLSQDDQDLLTLRIDRDLSWRDVAAAMSASDLAADDAELRRLETALRQRLAEVKKRLHRLALSAGLLVD